VCERDCIRATGEEKGEEDEKDWIGERRKKKKEKRMGTKKI
jgi:hypothetical protein